MWYVGPNRAEIRPETLPADLGPGEVRIEALYGGLSRGTERLVFTGCVPASEYSRMRAPFMAGNLSFPVEDGFAPAGRWGGRPGPFRCRPASSSPPAASPSA